MKFTLYYHPLSSFCWKALIALYENQLSFEPHLVDLMTPQTREEFLKIWPIGQFPVLKDHERNEIIPQSTVIIEYLQLYYPGSVPLIPSDPALALECRRWNEFLDDYVHVQMQKAGSNSMRKPEDADHIGEGRARELMRTAYDILEDKLQGKTWLVGENFSMADIAACPSLFYGNMVEPFLTQHANLKNYLERLQQRPVFARVIQEAKPYFQFIPFKKDKS